MGGFAFCGFCISTFLRCEAVRDALAGGDLGELIAAKGAVWHDILSASDKLFEDIGTLYTAHTAALRAQRHAVTKEALAQLDTLLDQHPDPRTWDEAFHAERRTAKRTGAVRGSAYGGCEDRSLLEGRREAR